MAALNCRTTCMLWLLFSALTPGEARRQEQGSDPLSSETQSDEVTDGGKAGKHIHCPQGLTASQTGQVCTSEQFEKGTTSALWSTTGSGAPLVFQPAGGVYMVESQFLAEIAVAFTDETMKLTVANSLALDEMKKNATFRDLVSKQAAKEHGKLHTLKEDLEPAYFVLEHTAEHLVLEGLAIGFHALEHAAHAGTVIGGATMEAVAGFAGEALHFVIADILPVLIPIQTGFMIWQVRKHYKHETHHAKNFVNHLVLKSDCMVEKLDDSLGSEALSLKASIPDLCTTDVATHVGEQIQRTMQAKVEVFKMLASIGRCLWPHNKRAWSKVNCIEASYFELLQHDGQSGILYSVLSFMAYYGHRVDELLEAPYYGQWYQEEFGIENHAEGISLLPRMLEVKDKPLADRLPVCMQLMATHRAFERTFERMKDAIRIWMQTFARSFMKGSIRGSWFPCKKVFYKMSDFEDNGMCKHKDWHIGHGKVEHAVVEDNACEQAAAFKGSLWPETEKTEGKKGEGKTGTGKEEE